MKDWLKFSIYILILVVVSNSILLAGYIVDFIKRKFPKLILSQHYRKLLSPLECALLDEDISDSDQKCTLVSTFILDGDLATERVRELFDERVLKAKPSKNSKNILFPEFKQYITTLFGLRIWKNEENFRLSDHIREAEEKCDFINIDSPHQNLQNQKFREKQSPWEIVVFRNVIIFNENAVEINNENLGLKKTLVAFRVHHVMCDAKSIVKIFVEQIGQKALNTAEARESQWPWWRRMWFPIAFSIYFAQELWKIAYLPRKLHPNPWKGRYNDNCKITVKFTKPLKIMNIKACARKYGVTTSTVLITVIVEAIKKLNNLQDHENTVAYFVFPKKDHPTTLANHFRGGFDLLPSNPSSNSLTNKLRIYNSFLENLRRPESTIILETIHLWMGILPQSVRKFLRRNCFPSICFTNVAGEKDGFSIDNVWCSEYRMSACAGTGNAGAVFCMFSYRDQIRISITGKEKAMSEEDTANVIRLIEQEYENMLVEEPNQSPGK